MVSWSYSGHYPTRMEYIWVARKELGGTDMHRKEGVG